MLTREEFQLIYDQGFEAVWAVIEALQKAVLTQQLQIETLTARVKELEDRLNKDSHNSSKPPSSDGYKKKPVSLREPTERKPGGQQGHSGKTLSFSETPDAIVVHSPEACRGCGHSLSGVSGAEGERRQVLDLPPLALVTTEHRALCKVCPHCGVQNVGGFPEEVTLGVGYGAPLKAFALYLQNYQFLPSARITEMLSDLFGTTFSEGTLFRVQQAASRKLEGFLSHLRELLVGSPVVHFDETGLRICGKLNWLHSASTPDLTLYQAHPKRGKAGMDVAGVLPSFTGVAVHDGWASYLHYGARHALCNAHHLRELTALYEQAGQEWASKMRHLLVEIKNAVERCKAEGATRLPPLLRQEFLVRYHTLLKDGSLANPPNLTDTGGKRGRKKQSKAYNLLQRLEQGCEETLRFMDDFSVPFDNNLAERDIRMMKVQQKVSGGFRSPEGAEAFCRIRSYISTLRKQGHSILPALQILLTGQPILPTT